VKNPIVEVEKKLPNR